jgi:hypothetical protein
MLAIVAIAFTSCQKDQLIEQKDEVAALSTPSTPISDGLVTPIIVDNPGPGGNVTCDMLDGNFPLSTGKFNYIKETDEWEDDDEVIFENFPYEGITVEYDPETKTLSFTANVPGYCVGAVIVKGGPSANIYLYPEGTSSDSGLGAPDNADLSNLTFCLIECEEEECWEGETAWGGNTVGGGAGWWYYYDTNGPVRQDFYAGQNLVEGAYVEVIDGVMTIVLGENMRLDPEATDPVKVQGYNTIPNRRPAAGVFTTYKGYELSFPVDPFTFYAIHLDVEVKVECPEEPIE